MEVKLFIDGREADTDQTSAISISLGIASITKIETGRTGYSRTIRIPATVRNRRIMGDTAEIHGVEQFNRETHTARIEADGFVVLEGAPMLIRYERPEGGSGWYDLSIVGAGKRWVEQAAETMFNETDIAFETTIGEDTVRRSWSWEHPVRFFPVQRDRFAIPPAGGIEPSVRVMTFDDYHPFLHLRTLLDAIVGGGGYRIRSEFMDGEFFRSLYISGRYPEKEVELLQERMGFLAGRLTDASATADRFGRVYADPLSTLSSVGNIVDTADPEEEADGISVEEAYNRNGCFCRDGKRIAYRPPQSVYVGFEYTLLYRSDYRIADREELRCFDRVWLDDDIERKYRVPNRFEDKRERMEDNWRYRLVVFGHKEGDAYRLTCEATDTATGESTETELALFASRSTAVDVSVGRKTGHPKLWIRMAGTYVPYTGDWALYDGYVTETGQIDISLRVRSSAAECSPSSPRYFDRIHFGGAEEGMALTLSRDVRLKPVFMAHPCEGSKIGWADVAAHRIRQIELVRAVRQMFNLYFYSDPLTGTLYVEPRETFYRNTPVVDWSGKIDRSRPVAVEEPGAELPEYLTLRYMEGDGSVARWDETNKQVLGRWSAPLGNRFALDRERIYSNPLFTPTLNRTGAYPDAAAATLVQAGDRDRKGNPPDTENLNFPPKIVRFTGLVTLPEGQYWGWPGYGKVYPKIAFHDPEAEPPTTLCFEDRDGAEGLHRYYDRQLAACRNGRRITLYLNLNPEDIEPLASPDSLCRDFRALYRLTIEGETVLCRLEEICDYNPLRQPTRCIFIKNV